MIQQDRVAKGSKTAKGGFQNEDDIVFKFNSWKIDYTAQEWLESMGYRLEQIDKVVAVKLHGYKTDVQVQITIYLKDAISAENLSIKLVSNPQGFNQIDKRWVNKYRELWDIPDDIVDLLKEFTGEIPSKRGKLLDPRRVFFSEMDLAEQEKISKFFEKNKVLIVSDLIKGRGIFSAGWMLVALVVNGESKWTLKSINHAMNIFAQGDVTFTKQGNLKIGKIGMQRKGGDGGRPTANMLQFKVNPVLLFD